MKLGIVGHAQEKFTTRTERCARDAIYDAIDVYAPDVVISGRSPMGGVDIYAAEAAKDRGIEMVEFVPKVHQWNPVGKYGYKARNLDIANHSDLVISVVCQEYPPEFPQRIRFTDCYHCKGRVPEHAKSGGCWTAWQCKNHRWFIISVSGEYFTKFDPATGRLEKIPT